MNLTGYKGLPRNKLSILWCGQHERPKSGTGGDTHPTRKFGVFFLFESSQQQELQVNLFLFT